MNSCSPKCNLFLLSCAQNDPETGIGLQPGGCGPLVYRIFKLHLHFFFLQVLQTGKMQLMGRVLQSCFVAIICVVNNVHLCVCFT